MGVNCERVSSAEDREEQQVVAVLSEINCGGAIVSAGINSWGAGHVQDRCQGRCKPGFSGKRVLPDEIR